MKREIGGVLPRWHGGKGTLRVAVPVILLGLLAGCATTTSSCPPWPKAGPRVADELERTLNEQGKPKPEWQDTWDWLQRLDKLEKQLKVCQ